MTRLLCIVLFAWTLSAPIGGALAQEEPAAPEQAEPEEEEVAAVAVFAHGYPVRFARRPLVLDEGMVRADGRVTIGGVKLGSGTFSSLDIGGAVSPIENLELGLST
jgi:hypothetical protein